MLTKEEDQLVQVQSIFFFTSGMAGVFFQIFLFKLSGFAEVMYFNIALFFALFAVFIASGYILKHRSTRTLIRTGLLLMVFVWFSVLGLQEKTKDFLLPLGLLYGAAGGFYWSGFNLSQYVLTHSERRSNFFGKMDTLAHTSRAFAPFVAGLMIYSVNKAFNSELRGYYVLFSIVFVLQIYVVMLAKNLPRHSGVEFSLRSLFTIPRSRRWRLILMQQFTSGLYDNAFSVLSGILVFVVLVNETQVGLLQSCAALVMAGSSHLAGKLYKKNKNMYVYGALAAASALLIFGLTQSIYTVILFMILHAGALPFLAIPTSVAILAGYDEVETSWQDKYHLFIQRDSILGIARILSFVILFMLFSQFDKVVVARNWFLVAAVVPLGIGYLLHTIYSLQPKK
jgi:YQGE family putative transporter